MTQPPSREESSVRIDAHLPARGEPRFILKHEGKYYVTLGVWVYDPNAQRNAKQERGVDKVREDFERLRRDFGRDAVLIPEELLIYSDPGTQTWGEEI